MPVIKSEFSCPICKRASGALHQIIANAGELQCSGNSNHRWNDTQAFYNEGPTMDFKPEMPKNLPQENHTPLTITVPIRLKETLEQMYGQKLSATCAAILSQMSEGRAMVIPDTDVERLKERLGKRPDNSGELVGLIYSLVCQTDDAKSERDTAVKDLKAYEGLAPGRIVVDLGDQYVTAQAKAKDAELPLKLWVERAVTGGLRDGWF
jgi:hypothetical protein